MLYLGVFHDSHYPPAGEAEAKYGGGPDPPVVKAGLAKVLVSPTGAKR